MKIREIHFYGPGGVLDAILDITEKTDEATLAVQIAWHERLGHTLVYKEPTPDPCASCVAAGACTEEREEDCHSGIPMKGGEK